jgi:hydrogenase maturation protein HypF
MTKEKNNKDIAYSLTIKGLVQGVGFRPFVYNLANELDIQGWTMNTNHAVIAHIQGNTNNINRFLHLLTEKKPPASIIYSIDKKEIQPEKINSFQIIPSEIVSNEVTYVSPDIAVCDECLNDLHFHLRRKNYPLVNCCHCGPRYTIIKSLPYDREQTTMQPFEMCDDCRVEYENPQDRRFHAQPVACNNCGPTYTLHNKKGKIVGINEILSHLSRELEDGRIFAIKGIGGFFIVCNAHEEKSVARLRLLKHRDTKPFAVMFRNIEVMKKYVEVDQTAESELTSFRRPIVILKEIKPLAPSVTLNLGTIGAMLPYMPFHFLLFEKLTFDALVMTSGNISEEPIIIDNKVAIATFMNSVDGVITYNRDIYNRVDDSVLAVVNQKHLILRRSRGYVPVPVNLNVNTEGIFAAGAELTGTFAIGKGSNIIASQYLGDLQNFENLNFYTESYQQYKNIFRFEPSIAVHDMHPDYVSTRFALDLHIPFQTVQHHQAHIASVMAEYNLDEKIIGVAFDGTGLGTDGNIWGSEFLICDPVSFERYAHFNYIPLPGGDKAVLEPWRSGIAYLYNLFGENILNSNLPFIKEMDKTKLQMIIEAIDRKINTPFSCSAGRLFDAVAAVTKVCINPSFHAEAPMRLEAAISKSNKKSYPYTTDKQAIRFDTLFEELCNDLKNNTDTGIISSKFHNTIVDVIIDTCKKIRNERGIHKVALSGGSFQNRYLLEKVENYLKENLFKVYVNRQFPVNDGGIALGQLYVTAKKREKCV